MTRYNNSPPTELPGGTMSLTRFAWIHHMAHTTLHSHVVDGIDGERIECVTVKHGEVTRRYLTPGQQRQALAFWDRHGIRYRARVLKVGGEK